MKFKGVILFLFSSSGPWLRSPVSLSWREVLAKFFLLRHLHLHLGYIEVGNVRGDRSRKNFVGKTALFDVLEVVFSVLLLLVLLENVIDNLRWSVRLPQLMVVVALALFTAIKEVIVGVTMRGINTKTIQPKTSNAKIPNPSFGRKEPDVIQANLEAGISGSKSCFHLGFRTITDDPGTCTVILN